MIFFLCIINLSQSFSPNTLNYCLLNDKKMSAQKVWFKNLVYKKPFGYLVLHHRYSLMSCPGESYILFFLSLDGYVIFLLKIFYQYNTNLIVALYMTFSTKHLLLRGHYFFFRQLQSVSFSSLIFVFKYFRFCFRINFFILIMQLYKILKIFNL